MLLQHFHTTTTTTTTTTNTTSLSSFFLDDLFSFCTFLISNPLPFAYLLFFSPHILSLLSFLSPLLLLSTTLLLLTFTTTSPHHHADELTTPCPPPKSPGKTCAAVLRFLKRIEVECDAAEDPIGLAEHLDWIVLLPPTLCIEDSVVGHGASEMELDEGAKESEGSDILMPHSPDEDRGSENNEERQSGSIAEDASKAAENCEDLAKSSSIRRRALHTRTASEGLQREASMRKEREWKRTLACKLYEERITFKLYDERAVDVKGGEEMDLLWEAYEDNASKTNNRKNKEKKRAKDECKKEAKAKAEAKAEAEDDDDDDDEEEEGSVRQLCCLKALKLSASNMNLGVGRPNLMKISKVLKGMRMFQHFGKHSNSRKK